MFYVGLDPSFTGCGISIINSDTKVIDLIEISASINKKSTISKLQAISDISNQVKDIISKGRNSYGICIGQEVSTDYTGWFVAELFGLAYGIYEKILTIDNVDSYSLYSQGYIKYIHGHRIIKEDTIFLVEDLLNIFRKYGYTVNIDKTAMTSTGVKEPNKNRYIKKETITNNEADSFIYALRKFIEYNKPLDLSLEILDKHPRFLDDNKELK